MIEIILQILSIIGIVLLIILGLFLCLLCIVLFVPVRYKINMQKEKDLFLFIKAHFLLHFITVTFEYPNSQAIILKIAGIPIYNSKKTKESKKNNKTKKTSEEKKSETSKISNEQFVDSNIEEKSVDSSKFDENVFELNVKQGHENIKNSKISIFQKAKNFYKKVIEFIKKVKYTITHFYDIIKNIKDNIEFYLSILKDEQTIEFIRLSKKRLLKIIKKVLPKKIIADIHFGTGSPDTTGYLLALYGMICPHLGKDVVVTSDFENKVFQGKIFLKGKIRSITILVNVLAIVFDKNFRPVIHKFKREA